LKHFFIRWFINTVALMATAFILSKGIWLVSWQACLAGALVLGLMNAFVRPVLLFLTLPLNILTLGLFTILLNAAIFFSVGYIIEGVMIRNYPWAIAGSVVFSVISTALSWLFHERRQFNVRFHLWRL
jgi:putative membrane protein